MTTSELIQPKPRSWRSQILPYVMVAPPLLLMVLLIFVPAIQSIIRTLTIDVEGQSGFQSPATSPSFKTRSAFPT